MTALSVVGSVLSGGAQQALGNGVGARLLDIGGSELATNGLFGSNITGWTDASSAGGSVAWNAANGGVMRGTYSSGTSRARQTVTGIETGKRYYTFAQCVAATVNGTFAIGSSTPGSSDYRSTTAQAALAARAAVAEFTAVSDTVQYSFNVGAAGSCDWDNVTLRKLTPTSFPIGTVFEDDFSLKADGPLGVTPDGLIWREMVPQNAVHVYPYISSGKMAVTANASGATAGYPYLDLGNGKVKSMHCDIEWSGAGASVAMISLEPSSTIPTVTDITTNSLHIVFTDDHLDIQTYVAGNRTSETVNYTQVELDGRTYAGIGWSLTGSTLTLTLPDGSTIQRTDSKFSQVQGSHAIPEIYYSSPTVGPVTVSAVAVGLG